MHGRKNRRVVERSHQIKRLNTFNEASPLSPLVERAEGTGVRYLLELKPKAFHGCPSRQNRIEGHKKATLK